jgi:ATP-dependent HslUV protease ATP-binding subunit HslU
LLATEKVHLDIQADAVAEIARIAADVNQRMENIGARRLHTVMEKLLDELSFEAPDLGEQTVPITGTYVRDRLQSLLKDEDLSQYVL